MGLSPGINLIFPPVLYLCSQFAGRTPSTENADLHGLCCVAHRTFPGGQLSWQMNRTLLYLGVPFYTSSCSKCHWDWAVTERKGRKMDTGNAF